MRVLHISSPKSWRGGEQQLMYLVEELKLLGVHQVVLCPFNSEVHKYCLKKHLNHHTYFKGFSANPMVAFRVKHVCSKEHIDLIHVHDSHAHNFALLSHVLTNNDAPIVISRRVDFPIQGHALSVFKYNHPQIKRIICVSEAIRSVMDSYIEDKTKLCVVHSGIDISKFNHAQTNRLRTEFQIPAHKILIGNVAALAAHKDYPTFVKTARQLIDAGLNAKFFIIGEGPCRKEIENTIAQEAMDEHILLTGFRNDIVDILPELDLFLITSKTEGLGTSILDALASKVVVVATAAGGIVEIIQDKVNGRICPVADPVSLKDAVLETLRNSEARKQYIEQGWKTVLNFSKSIMANKTLEIYNEVIASSSGDSALSE